MTYTFRYYHRFTVDVRVEAENKEEARKKWQDIDGRVTDDIQEYEDADVDICICDEIDDDVPLMVDEDDGSEIEFNDWDDITEEVE